MLIKIVQVYFLEMFHAALTEMFIKSEKLYIEVLNDDSMYLACLKELQISIQPNISNFLLLLKDL